MKRVLFVCTHLGSSVEYFDRILEFSPKIQFYHSGISYKYPTDLSQLTNLSHKSGSEAAIYGDVLLFNESVIGKCLYNSCSFIYLLRRANPTISFIKQNNLYDPTTAIDYYIFRIRRLYEMATQTPGAVLLTWDNLKNGHGFDLVTDYLGLMPFADIPDCWEEPTDLLPQSSLEEAEQAYEGMLYRMRKLNLRMVNPG